MVGSRVGDPRRERGVELVLVPAQGGERLGELRRRRPGSMRGGTLVSVAAGVGPGPTSTPTSPACVRSARVPGPWRSAQATPVAIVACPQKGTSASGEK